MFDDKLKLKFGLFGKKNQMESTTSGGSFRGWVYGQATRRNPTDPVRNEDGTWNGECEQIRIRESVGFVV